MKVTAIKTPIVQTGDDIQSVITNAIPHLAEKSVLVVTSKVIALSEQAVLPKSAESKTEVLEREAKREVVRREADLYLEPTESKYNVMLTVRHGLLAVNAGVDESNVNGGYVLLPQHPYRTARQLWQLLRQEYSLREVGVLITDSTSMPLKWGTMGRALAHCGFEGLKDMIGTPDLFGRELVMTKMNIAEGLAAAAVLEMGEGSEQTPLCVIEDITHIKFMNRPLSEVEIAALQINIHEDVYEPLLTSVTWQHKKK